MITYLLSNPPDLPVFLVGILAAVVAITVHEFAHAKVASWLGDPTGRLAGRLSLNPRRHLDPMGSFVVLVAGFGWGKPVPVAKNKLGSKGRRIVVALAGPGANAGLAVLAALAIGAIGAGLRILGLLVGFLIALVQVNLLNAVFNLLPIPPLDGFPILEELLPQRRSEIIYFLEKWGFLILLAAAFVLFRPVLGPILAALAEVLARLAGAVPGRLVV